jgi:hypothetical protein
MTGTWKKLLESIKRITEETDKKERKEKTFS